ncbi:MAG: hypothetical protein WAW86_06350 [Gammaproteobacteria bacterium]
MQGFAFKSTIATTILLTVALSNSFAASTSLTYKAMQNRGNNTTAAGCMGCHQGETEATPDNEIANNSDETQASADQKQSSTQINESERKSS